MVNSVHPNSLNARETGHRDYVLIGAWVLLAVIAGLLVGVTIASTGAVSAPAKQSGSNTPFSLTLVITPNNAWNSTTTAPRYWVLTPNGLRSAANISIPAHTLIVLTIIDYDSPSPLPAQFAQVSGTIGNQVYLLNGSAYLVNGSSVFINQSLAGATKLSWINPNTEVSHTFTVPQLGINIPSAGESTEVAEFYVNQTGVFSWHCMDPCGFGPSGWAGPMSAPGWMSGSLTVYNP